LHSQSSTERLPERTTWDPSGVGKKKKKMGSKSAKAIRLKSGENQKGKLPSRRSGIGGGGEAEKTTRHSKELKKKTEGTNSNFQQRIRTPSTDIKNR